MWCDGPCERRLALNPFGFNLQSPPHIGALSSTPRCRGSDDLATLPSRVCDGLHCANLRDDSPPRGQRRRHLVLLGADAARTQRVNRDQKYRVPPDVIEYIGQFNAVAAPPTTGARIVADTDPVLVR